MTKKIAVFPKLFAHLIQIRRRSLCECQSHEHSNRQQQCSVADRRAEALTSMHKRCAAWTSTASCAPYTDCEDALCASAHDQRDTSGNGGRCVF